MCFVNKMDRLGADFFAALESIRDRLGANIAVLQLPIGAEGHYKGVIDLVTMQALVWLDEELGAKWEVREIPENLKAQAEDYRHQLIDVLSTFDENILEKYVGDEEITVDDLQAASAPAPSPTRSCPCSTAPPSRTRACSRCSTPSSPTCPAPSTCPRSPACR